VFILFPVLPEKRGVFTPEAMAAVAKEERLINFLLFIVIY